MIPGEPDDRSLEAGSGFDDGAPMLGLLGELAERMGTARDVPTVFRALRDFAVATTPTTAIFVSRYHAERRERTPIYVWVDGEELDVSALPPLPMSATPHSRAVATGRIVVTTDLQAQLQTLPHVDVGLDRDPRLPQSSLAAPMIVAGRVVGGFELQSTMPAGYRDEHLPSLRLAATLAAIATENVRLLDGERQLRELAEASEAWLQDLVQGVDALVFEIDAATLSLTFVTRRIEAMLGYPPEEAIGTLARWLELVHDEDRERAREALMRGIEGSDVDAELRLQGADGQTVWVHVVARGASTDDRGKYLRGVAIDITERRRLEEQLLAAQKMEAIGQLAGGIAHDFNNLLMAIRGSAQLLLEELPGEDHYRRDAIAILDAADRGTALVRQLLAFGRRQRIEPVIIDLGALVHEMAPMLRRLIGSSVQLRLASADHLARVKADRAQLQQLLLNLVLNARDAMPGGGEITLETTNVELDEAFARAEPELEPGRYVILSVKDTGVGMDRETRMRAFEPFFTTKPTGEGTGLGLATVYGIVKQSGGHVTVESEVGQGSTFRVYLPARAEPATVGEAESDRAPSGRERILVVEDEDAVRSLLTRMLTGLGYGVVAASSGAEALALLDGSAQGVDLLVTDVIMPGMQGPEVVTRALERQPALRAVIISGYPGPPRGGHEATLDGHVFLQKPFTLASLARAVRAALEAPRN